MRLRRSKTDITPTDLLVMEVGALMECTAERAAAAVGRAGFTPGYRVIGEGRRVVVYRLEDRSASDFEDRQQDFAARLLPMLVQRFGRMRVKALRYQGVYHGYEVRVV